MVPALIAECAASLAPERALDTVASVDVARGVESVFVCGCCCVRCVHLSYRKWLTKITRYEQIPCAGVCRFMEDRIRMRACVVAESVGAAKTSRWDIQ